MIFTVVVVNPGEQLITNLKKEYWKHHLDRNTCITCMEADIYFSVLTV